MAARLVFIEQSTKIIRNPRKEKYWWVCYNNYHV